MLIKPKFWDYKKPNFLSYLFLILTIPLRLNNLLLKFKPKKEFQNVKTICIGNIYLGGTGKTPTSIKLYELLKKKNYDLLTAKKFYPSQLDEQILLKKKTNFITEKTRKKIVEVSDQKKINLVIFDDGLQDRKINYDIQFVCFDAQNWIGNGQLIPAGPLRENLSSLKKYDAIFLKNKSQISNDVIRCIKNHNNQILIFNTFYKIKNLKNFSTSEKYLIFSGIGNPKDFKNLLITNKLNIVDEIIFPDHYKYQNKDIEKIKKRALDLKAKIITTEKDYVKIHDKYHDDIDFIQIDIEIENENDLINFIERKINE